MARFLVGFVGIKDGLNPMVEEPAAIIKTRAEQDKGRIAFEALVASELPGD